MMKKILSILLIALLSFLIVGCNNANPIGGEDNNSIIQTQDEDSGDNENDNDQDNEEDDD